MAKSLEELIDEAVEGYIFTSCKDYGNSRSDFDLEWVKYTLVQNLVDQTMEELYPRGEYNG